MIAVATDFNKVALNFKAYGKNVDKATVSTVNKLAAQTKTNMSKTIRESYTIKARDVNSALSIRKARFGKPVASVFSTSKRKWLSISKFKAHKTSKGAKIEIIKGQRKVIKHSFVATMPSGHKGVFKREGDKRLMKGGRYVSSNIRTRKQYERQPIVEIPGPSTTTLFASRKVTNTARIFVKANFNRILNSELKYYENKK